MRHQLQATPFFCSGVRWSAQGGRLRRGVVHFQEYGAPSLLEANSGGAASVPYGVGAQLGGEQLHVLDQRAVPPFDEGLTYGRTNSTDLTQLGAGAKAKRPPHAWVGRSEPWGGDGDQSTHKVLVAKTIWRLHRLILTRLSAVVNSRSVG